MTRQVFPRSSKLVRFALTGLMATQAEIATTAVHKFIATTPGSSRTQPKYRTKAYQEGIGFLGAAI